MKQIFSLATLLLISLISFAQQPNFEWAVRMGGTNHDQAESIAVDAIGNVYATGSFQNQTDFDPSGNTYFLNAFGFTDIFISKTDGSGDFIWAKQMGGVSSEQGLSITTDGLGNVYTTGEFNGIADFDPGANVYNLTSSGSLDIFVSKLDPSGNFVWAKRIGGSTNEESLSIAVDAEGNVYTTGTFTNIADFNPDVATNNLTSFGGNDIFISKLDSNGNFVWAKQLGGTSNDEGRSITTDALGNVYSTGSFTGTSDFDPGTNTFNLTGVNDIFISKLDSNGNFIWAKQMGGTLSDEGRSIVLDTAGNVFTTGDFHGTADFNPGTSTFNLTSAGDRDIFVSKLNNSGNFVWAKRIGGVSLDHGESIDIDALGNLYTTGYFYESADFNPNSGIYNLTSNGLNDIFISKLNPNGSFGWAKQIGGISGDQGTELAIDNNGNIYTAGGFVDTVDFNPSGGTFKLSSNTNNYDIFIQKMSTCTSVATTLNDSICEGESFNLPWGETVTTPGTYSHVYTLQNGCDSTVNISLAVHPNPTITVAPITICDGQSGTLSAIGATTYFWSPSTGLSVTTGATVTANPTSTLSYTIIGTNNSGCTDTTTTIVTVSPCPTPTDITVINITGTKATITWTGSSCAVKYRIQYRVQGTIPWTTKTVSAPTETKILSGLLPETTYEYQIRTECNADGTSASAYSILQTFTTICDCDKPTNIAVSNVTQTTATVSWLGNSCAVKYRLQYRLQGTTVWTTKKITSPTLFYNITGLTSNSIYEYRLRSDCNSGGSINSGWTNIATITTTTRLGETEIGSTALHVTPNPCSTCVVSGIDNEHDLIITDIVGRVIVAQFTKSAKGFYINMPEASVGLYIIRNKKTAETVKFVRE